MKFHLGDDDLDTARELVRKCRLAASRIIGARGEEFAMAVLDRVESINEFMDDKNFVTENQIQALRNMLKGLLKWI